MQRWFKIFAAVIAVGLIILAAAFAWSLQPSLFSWRYELKIASGPIGGDGQKIVAAFIREVAAERPIVRLVPVPTDSLSASGKALIDGQVDLAVVRSDDAAAAQGRTVFILRRIGIAIILPPESKIENVSELLGKKLAVIKAAHFDPALLKAFTSFYGLRDSDLVELTLPEVGRAMKAKRVVAALVFGPIGAGTISDAFAAVRKSFKDKPSYLDIEEAEAIAARWPAYEAVEIKQGIFGGAPPEPAEAINTFAVSVRLVTRASLPDRVAGEITRLLLSTKAKLASTLPIVGEMEAPPTEKTSVLPVHPGTLAYLNGEQVALLDETLNYYWLGAMVFAVVAPLAGWIASRREQRRGAEGRSQLLRLINLVRLAKTGSPAELADVDEELDTMTEWLLEKSAAGELERNQFQSIEWVISQLRAKVAKRLIDLAGPGGNRPRGGAEDATPGPTRALNSSPHDDSFVIPSNVP
jgi:TRAP transporter TAXI family solute receptor